MATLPTPRSFQGRHYETGSLSNALALQGVKAPHTGQPYSEALLLGVSGGIAVGYFIFEYKGYLPHIALLTRNTFDPLETIFERLAIPRDVQQTTDPATGQANLDEVLDSGRPALVWADMFSLPYNRLPRDDQMWAMIPIVAYARTGGDYLVADRSARPFHLSAAELAAARGRVKKDRFRIMTVEAPDPKRLAAAVQKGLWQCVSLFTESPPKGAKTNFGFAALNHWANMLTNTRNKQSWERLLPPGPRLAHALLGSLGQPGAFQWIMTWGAAPGAERGLYADFLDEAATILKRPALKEVAAQFRHSYDAWIKLATVLLPNEIPLFAEARHLLLRKHDLFVKQGQKALEEIDQINARLNQIGQAAAEHFPLSDAEVKAYRANLRDHLLKIHDLERKAVAALELT